MKSDLMKLINDYKEPAFQLATKALCPKGTIRYEGENHMPCYSFCGKPI